MRWRGPISAPRAATLAIPRRPRPRCGARSRSTRSSRSRCWRSARCAATGTPRRSDRLFARAAQAAPKDARPCLELAGALAERDDVTMARRVYARGADARSGVDPRATRRPAHPADDRGQRGGAGGGTRRIRPWPCRARTRPSRACAFAGRDGGAGRPALEQLSPRLPGRRRSRAAGAIRHAGGRCDRGRCAGVARAAAGTRRRSSGGCASASCRRFFAMAPRAATSNIGSPISTGRRSRSCSTICSREPMRCSIVSPRARTSSATARGGCHRGSRRRFATTRSTC